MRRLITLIAVLCFSANIQKAHAQLPSRVLVGYWHNWNQTGLPFIKLSEIDERYNVICLSFAIGNNNDATDMKFSMWSGSSYNDANLKTDIIAKQNEGKVVLMSVGGANGSFRLTSSTVKDGFVADMKAMIQNYGVDGIDIDLEQKVYVCMNGGTIQNPTDVHVTNMIAALQELLAWYQTTYNKKMILTMAPETVYVQGGLSSYQVSNICGGSYLPIIEALRDDIDLMMVQLYNSGDMCSLNGCGTTYNQGTAEFVTSQTEALIKGFTAVGGLGTFSGLPASKVVVALPACSSAGSGYIAPSTLEPALNYLLGEGPKAGTYTLKQAGGHPTLRGLMTWSINNDALSTCGGAYSFAQVFEDVFYPLMISTNEVSENKVPYVLYPNPVDQTLNIQIDQTYLGSSIEILDVTGKLVYQAILNTNQINVANFEQGVYLLRYAGVQKTFVKK